MPPGTSTAPQTVGGTASPNPDGVVFKLTPGLNNKWTETVLYNFSGGTDGGELYGTLVSDAAGNLYGTGIRGGSSWSRRCIRDRPVSERTSDPLATGFGRTFVRSSPLMGQFHKLDCRPGNHKIKYFQ